MMNTWGDRNKDASINEQFVKKEIDACEKLHISHFHVDEGWQQGRSRNSANPSGVLWNKWTEENWQPDSLKFPNGFKVVTDYAQQKGIALGLWFHPSSENDYEQWRQDAAIVIGLYNTYAIRYFKIDGVKLQTKKAEINFRKFLDTVMTAADHNVVFNLDLIANNRGGYHYFYEYGNLFLENRYADWGNYYPHWTLRNLWMLSKYVPPERLQIEFLNAERNPDKYPTDNIYAPSVIPFDYQFAVTMMAQPLAWFEGTGLFEKGSHISKLIKDYRDIEAELHSGNIFPIGDEPSGSSRNGFQSVSGKNSGYNIVYCETTEETEKELKTYLTERTKTQFKKILGYGHDFGQTTDSEGKVTFEFSGGNQFALYKYLCDE